MEKKNKMKIKNIIKIKNKLKNRLALFLSLELILSAALLSTTADNYLLAYAEELPDGISDDISDTISDGISADTSDNSVTSSASDTVIQNKEEVVYANLSPEGNLLGVYVINHFNLSGSGKITDYGTYDSVANLTDLGALTYQNGVVSFETEVENFYYQGNMNTADIPWNFDISYYLDGKEMSASEVAGNSGNLEIKIKTTQNPRANAAFYDGYMLQVSVTLDTEKCSNIAADGATVASAGASSVLAFTVMPGKDGNISVTAKVKDFSMAGIDISALPFSMNIEMPDTGEMVGEFEQLSDGIAELNDGVGKLSASMQDLKDGSEDLTEGSAKIQGGLSQLSGSGGQLLAASTQVNNALGKISATLSNNSSADPSTSFNLDDLGLLPAGLSGLKQGLDTLSTNLDLLSGGYAQAYSALDSAMDGLSLSDNTVSAEEIGRLSAAVAGNPDSELAGIVGRLANSYAAGQTAKGTYDYVEPALIAVNTALPEISTGINTVSAGLTQMSDGISGNLSELDQLSQLNELITGLSQLAASYDQLHQGLSMYIGGVGTMSASYGDFHTGTVTFDDGIGDLKDGVSGLYDGTSELNDGVADMPDMVQEEIDSLMSEYIGTDFIPVSFTSVDNKHTGLVQFVFSIGGIEPVIAETVEEDTDTALTFWDRVVALFK